MLYRSSIFGKTLALSLLALILSGCSQNFQDSASTAAEAYNNLHDVQMSPEQIASLPYASLFLRIDDSRQLFLVLGFDKLDKNTGQRRLTWLSADKSRITTVNGRIVYTSGFENDNLVGLSGSPTMPSVASKESWTATYDWMPGYRYQFEANVDSYFIANETLSNDSWTKQTRHIVEAVNFPPLNSTVYNNYWVATLGSGEQSRHQVVKSIQYIGPNMHKVEITMIKPYVPTLTINPPTSTHSASAKETP